MKNTQNFNKSEESLDNTLVNTINDLHRDRNEVREVLHEYQSGASKHLHMLPQIVFMCKQLLRPFEISISRIAVLFSVHMVRFNRLGEPKKSPNGRGVLWGWCSFCCFSEWVL